MPQTAPVHPPEFADVVESDPIDLITAEGFEVIQSTAGLGTIVVLPAEATEKIATGLWAAYP